MVDDESGLTHYASDMVKDWDGQMRHKDNPDGRHPQLDVGKAVRRDPLALTDIRPSTIPTALNWAILLETSNGVNEERLLMETDSISAILQEDT